MQYERTCYVCDDTRRTVKMSSGMHLCEVHKDQFAKTQKTLLQTKAEQRQRSLLFKCRGECGREYENMMLDGNMKCDECRGDPFAASLSEEMPSFELP